MSQQPTGPEQPLISHLLELRDRLLRIVVVVLVLFVGLYIYSDQLYIFISQPLQDILAKLPEGSHMIATGVASPFLVPFKLAMVAAVFLAIPFILHQAWAFIAPGLYKHEKRFAIPLLTSSVLLFYCGVTFAYFVVLPMVFGFFALAAPAGVAVMPDITNILDFILKLFFAFGVAFEIPIATFLLILTGITSVASLSEKRPYIIVGCFVVGMLVTPPDVFSQSILAIPMCLLFELGLLAGRFIKKPETTAEDAEDQA
ncbi:MAG: twin-arginine translocase subunit TatC [Oceanospirillaceae bacterium]|nr:twin-arginine translocase subunit TatC [Oceanospirillaceae bacterium]